MPRKPRRKPISEQLTARDIEDLWRLARKADEAGGEADLGGRWVEYARATGGPQGRPPITDDDALLPILELWCRIMAKIMGIKRTPALAMWFDKRNTPPGRSPRVGSTTRRLIGKIKAQGLDRLGIERLFAKVEAHEPLGMTNAGLDRLKAVLKSDYVSPKGRLIREADID